jgi:hypothetical protein
VHTSAAQGFRLYVFLFLSICMVFGHAVTARAQQSSERDVPTVRADLEVNFEAQNRADENRWVFDYPIYGNIGVIYEGDDVEAAASVDLIDEVSIGETYVQGGSQNSYLKLGYYTETWRTGYAWSVVDILNRRDDRYPSNVFYRNIMRPNPVINMSIGGSQSLQQIVVSQKDEELDSVEDALLGFHSLIISRDFKTGIGIIRRIGNPPPMIFLTAKTEVGQTSAWAEISWWVLEDRPDRVNALVGGQQRFASAQLIGEFIIDNNDLILYLEQESRMGSRARFDIRSYMYLNTFSASLDIFVSTDVDQYVRVDFGTMLFFGKEGSYFSRHDPLQDNDNKIYLKLLFSF